jgi:hypothetical protein
VLYASIGSQLRTMVAAWSQSLQRPVHRLAVTKVPSLEAMDKVDGLQPASIVGLDAAGDDSTPPVNGSLWISPLLMAGREAVFSEETQLITETRRYVRDTERSTLVTPPTSTWLRWWVWCSPQVLETMVSLGTTFLVALVLYVWMAFVQPILDGRQGTWKDQLIVWLVLMVPFLSLLTWVLRDMYATIVRAKVTTDGFDVAGSADTTQPPLIDMPPPVISSDHLLDSSEVSSASLSLSLSLKWSLSSDASSLLHRPASSNAPSLVSDYSNWSEHFSSMESSASSSKALSFSLSFSLSFTSLNTSPAPSSLEDADADADAGALSQSLPPWESMDDEAYPASSSSRSSPAVSPFVSIPLSSSATSSASTGSSSTHSDYELTTVTVPSESSWIAGSDVTFDASSRSFFEV